MFTLLHRGAFDWCHALVLVLAREVAYQILLPRMVGFQVAVGLDHLLGEVQVPGRRGARSLMTLAFRGI